VQHNFAASVQQTYKKTYENTRNQWFHNKRHVFRISFCFIIVIIVIIIIIISVLLTHMHAHAQNNCQLSLSRIVNSGVIKILITNFIIVIVIILVAKI